MKIAHCCRLFSMSGRYIRSIGTATKAPFGLCCYGNDQLLVSDRKLRCVCVCRVSGGETVRVVPAPPGGASSSSRRPVLSKPCSVVGLSGGRIAVADVGDHAVKVTMELTCSYKTIDRDFLYYFLCHTISKQWSCIYDGKYP